MNVNMLDTDNLLAALASLAGHRVEHVRHGDHAFDVVCRLERGQCGAHRGNTLRHSVRIGVGEGCYRGFQQRVIEFGPDAAAHGLQPVWRTHSQNWQAAPTDDVPAGQLDVIANARRWRGSLPLCHEAFLIGC